MTRKIDINISKGKITGFTITLGEEFPDVTASVDLYTANEKKITSFSLGTRSWDDRRFDLPANMIPPIRKMADQLEEILIREANKELALLEAK